MRYIHVHWRHKNPDEPVELYSELDEGSWETRKVEVLPDGRLEYASETESSGTTRLGLEPVPTLGEIASDPRFQACEIGRPEFEEVWDSASHPVIPGQPRLDRSSRP